MQRQECILAGSLQQPIRLRYLLYLPAAYRATAELWPLVLFLHGSGERGDDLSLVERHGLPRLLAQPADRPFIAIAPQCPADTRWSMHLESLAALLDEVSARERVDPARIYLTGLSLGGSGAWHLATAYPERFAALAPICGSSDWLGGTTEPLCRLRDLPVWVFHGAQDQVVPLAHSQRMVEALRACGGNPRLTIYPEVGHNSWNQAYADPALERWLLQQRRGEEQSTDKK